MAPTFTESAEQTQVDISTKLKNLSGFEQRKPLQLKGVLDQFKSFDVTPILGREFQDVNLLEWLRAPNSDDLLRDLAITISQRGVVFFRKQDDFNNDLQKELVQRLGELTGKPETSKLYIHPIAPAGQEKRDKEINVISSVAAEKTFSDKFLHNHTPGVDSKKQSGKDQWHSDITFEPVPSDYTLLRMTLLPSTGGDTLWASGYEVYDRISTPYQKFLETLQVTHGPATFTGSKIYTDPRGSPENVGDNLSCVHPLIRTNPVTGWKSVYGIGHHVNQIHGLTKEESQHLKDWFLQLVIENHDLQLRHRWMNENDMAIWDNRSMYHAATPDYEGLGLGDRKGQRAVGLGEKPYLDPNSVSRREALGL
jgi:alpha-ketoglutarate-dependent taurine dioxygenase